MEQNVQLENRVAELVKLLPHKLRMGFRVDVIANAIEENVLALGEDGHLVWQLDSKVLLAYFCGKMWSGDCGRYSRRKNCLLWQIGEGVFPGSDLSRLFGIGGLKQMRNNRKNLRLPENYELIDLLFVSVDTVNVR